MDDIKQKHITVRRNTLEKINTKMSQTNWNNFLGVQQQNIVDVENTEVNNKRKIHFISGLPRSGSTLLTNILLQNPKLYSSTTSSLLELLLQIRNNWGTFQCHKSNPEGQDKWRVINSILQTYHNTDKQIVFDKNRGWTNHIQFIEKVNGPSKFIICVRDIQDIVCSFEMLYRRNRSDVEIDNELSDMKMRTLKGRVEKWISDSGVIGGPYTSLLECNNLGLITPDRFLFMPYDIWTQNPNESFKQLYNFIGEDYFQHDFDNIKQVYVEDDELFGFGGDLHKIQEGKLSFKKYESERILGKDLVDTIDKSNFWKMGRN